MERKKSYIDAQSSYRRQKMITRGISVLSLHNLAASGANVSSTVPLSFTQEDILALSGDMAMMTGSFIPRMQCIFFLLVTKGVDRGGGGGARGAIAPPVLSYWYEYNYKNCMNIITIVQFVRGNSA